MLGNLHDTGHIAVRQVSQNTAFALYSGDRKSLDSLSYATLETPSVTGILFFSYTDGKSIIIGDITPEKKFPMILFALTLSKSMVTGIFSQKYYPIARQLWTMRIRLNLSQKKLAG